MSNHIIQKSFIGGEISAVDAMGNFLYLGMKSEFVIFEVSDIRSPEKLGSVTLPFDVEYIIVDNDIAFVIDFDESEEVSYIYTINIAISENPSIISSYRLNVNPSGMKMYNGKLFITDIWKGLYIFDVNVPTYIQQLGLYVIETGGWAVDVQEDIVYVAGGDGGLHIIDISNLQSTSLLSIIAFSDRVNYVTVVDEKAYLAVGRNGMYIVDITNPMEPRVLGQYKDELVNTGYISIIGNYAFLAGHPGSIIDISNQHTPYKVGEFSSGCLYDFNSVNQFCAIIHSGGIDIAHIMVDI